MVNGRQEDRLTTTWQGAGRGLRRRRTLPGRTMSNNVTPATRSAGAPAGSLAAAANAPGASSPPAGHAGRPVAALLPIIAVVFVAYLVIGLAMPVLPLHVNRGLGLGTFVVGLVSGSQFGAALL